MIAVVAVVNAGDPAAILAVLGWAGGDRGEPGPAATRAGLAWGDSAPRGPADATWEAVPGVGIAISLACGGHQSSSSSDFSASFGERQPSVSDLKKSTGVVLRHALG
jgi:hypothetical protein